MARLYAGTSGFSYLEWRGDFYPPDLPAARLLHHYSRRLPTVELNNTFYRFPSIRQVEAWREATPPGFRFALKAHRVITHQKRLRDVEEPLRLLLERADRLQDRRGPLLFQLPPSLRRDVGLLRDFLLLLPPGPRAVEVRHPSWHDDAVYALLEEHATPLAVMESDEDEPVLRFLGPFAYLRLHRSTYAPEALRAWADTVQRLLAAGRDVYAYFTHNGTPGYAYAAALAELVRG